ncbi:hypothetical protein [Dankookia sp. P2]|uniref:hypothetical protein n=1 Tax=Dankookia sp. P2 TaxID=3423955 RepID=UPI003D6782BF
MAPLRALPAAVVQDLYEIFDPSSKRNPFRTKAQRCRNWLLFILYLHLGLRRGEALMLSVDAFHAEYDHNKEEWYRWVNVTTLVDQDEEEAEGYEDPRSVAPSLKSPQSRRQLPVTEDVLRLVENYVDNWRVKSITPIF